MRAIPGVPMPSGLLADHLDAHPHAWSRAELLCHWSTRRLTRAVADGSVARLLPGVYCGSRHSADPVVRGEALNLWHPAGLVTGELALHLCARQLPAPDRAALVVPRGQHLRAPSWVRLLQVGTPRVSTSFSMVNCAVPERALLDAWRLAAPERRASIAWEALWARACSWRQLRREVERAPRVPGRVELERMLGWFAAGATTPLEVRARYETFADQRFREFEWQVPLALRSRRATVDMLHRRAAVVVELDGDRYHSTRQARDADRERQTDLVVAGFAVLRFGWRDVVDRPAWCRERVLTTVSARLGGPASARRDA
ncbi:endonuclease domain-containing protein [Demequina lignilytica]|uniref:DUF559 domain-containing protein n=1 Tax=Demequina lignilytica TaxID=3051663 RepID=A0AB35MK31_9MICO|nr:DUF559 domain-containing protein [Demequina sp. SYSU T0a273]MDN4484149.1 DUF559 domain-containing protein [Demequina sp. SYSU T0a273]